MLASAYLKALYDDDSMSVTQNDISRWIVSTRKSFIFLFVGILSVVNDEQASRYVINLAIFFRYSRA